MINRYSLADYTVTIVIPTFTSNTGTEYTGHTFTIGGPGANGEGSFIGEISIERNTETWKTEADPTGSWVHNKNLDRTGEVTLNIRQVSDDVIRLIMAAQNFENDSRNSKGIDITVSISGAGNTATTVATAQDCYIKKIPQWTFGESAAEQSWVFTSGRIAFPVTTSW